MKPALEYIRIGGELVAICPMILASYAGPRDEDTADDIHVRDRTTVHRTDNKIVLLEFFHIFKRSALWVHVKCADKTCNGWLVDKRI